GPIVAACTRTLRDLWLHDRPDRRPIFPARIEHASGRASSRAVEIQAGPVGCDELSRPRVDLIARSSARRALYREQQASRNRGNQGFHGELQERLSQEPPCPTDRKDRGNIAGTQSSAARIRQA